MNLTPELLEKLAEAAHDVWMEGKLRDGWTQGKAIDKPNKVHTCLISYSELSESDKESDRDFVRGIPVILAQAGLKIATTTDCHNHFIAKANATFVTDVTDGHFHFVPPGAVAGDATGSDIPVDEFAPGFLLGCTCQMCEFHRSAEEIERKRRIKE